MSETTITECTLDQQEGDEERRSGPPASKRALFDEVHVGGKTRSSLETSNIEDASDEPGKIAIIEAQDAEMDVEVKKPDQTSLDTEEVLESDGALVQGEEQELLVAEAQTKRPSANVSDPGSDQEIEVEEAFNNTAEDHQEFESSENTGIGGLNTLALAASLVDPNETLTASSLSEGFDSSYGASFDDISSADSWGEELRDEVLHIYRTYGVDTEESITKLEDMWTDCLRDVLEPLGWIMKFRDGRRGVVTDVHWKDFVATVKHPILEYKQNFSSGDESDGDSDSSDVEVVYNKIIVTEHEFPLEEIEVNSRQPTGSSFLPLQAQARLKTYSLFSKFLFWPGDTPYAKQWIAENLDARLHMWDDLVEGNIPEDLARDFISILSSFKKNHDVLNKLHKTSRDTPISDLGKSQRKEQSIVLGMEQDRHEKLLRYFVDPNVRAFAYRSRLVEFHGGASSYKSFEESNILVSENGVFSGQLMDALMKKINIQSQSKIRIVRTLAAAFLSCPPFSKIYLPEGNHYITGLCNLEAGGSLIGLGSTENVILEPRGGGDTWLMVRDRVELLNLTLKVRATTPLRFEGLALGKRWTHPNTCLLILEKGGLIMKNVILEGPGSQKNSTGIHTLHRNSSLELENVSISKFSVGLCSNAHGTIEASHISECVTGIKAFQSQTKQLFVDFCKIDLCQFGIRFVCEVKVDEVGDQTLLNRLQYPIEGTTFENCEHEVFLVAMPRVAKDPLMQQQQPLMSESSEEDFELPEEDDGQTGATNCNSKGTTVQDPNLSIKKIPIPLLTPPPEENNPTSESQ